MEHNPNARKWGKPLLKLAKSNAHQLVADDSFVIVDVEGHAFVQFIGWGGAEIGRLCITTPVGALLVTIASETRHEEARVERSITDQQLVGVWTGGSHGIPQSQSACTFSIIGCCCYWGL